MKSYITPAIVDRGAVSARTLGATSTATLESGANFRSLSNHPMIDNDVAAGKTLEKTASGTLVSPRKTVAESIEDNN